MNLNYLLVIDVDGYKRSRGVLENIDWFKSRNICSWYEWLDCKEKGFELPMKKSDRYDNRKGKKRVYMLDPNYALFPKNMWFI